MKTDTILVREYMKSLSLSFVETDSVEAVAAALVKRRELGAPVLDEQQKLVGFVTEQDCIKQMLNDSYYSQEHMLARDIMSRETVSVTQEDNIMHLAEQMIQNKPKLYPVLENERVVGIIARSDVLRALTQIRFQGKNH
ncbi:MAG: CBS domain-containing protein [Halomonadaceae bacterium]|nr:MAG: CBS domain-containing protein [Halomonadaceae bacterium]